MNKKEASALLEQYKSDYLRKTYDELKQMIDDDQVFEVRTDTGTKYQIEIDVIWEDEKRGILRLFVTVRHFNQKIPLFFKSISWDDSIYPDHLKSEI